MVPLLCRSRRSWKPNRQKRRLFSLGLDRHVHLDVTTHALRCIDRAGGLDEYMLKLPLRELHSDKLLYIRKRIAEAYDKKTMLPPDLEKKIRAVMEWNIQQKKKMGEPETEEMGEEGNGHVEDIVSKPPEDDYISEMFAKFSMKAPEQSREDLTAGFPPMGKDRPRDQRPDTSRPAPSAEEFPESLFSSM